MSVKKALTEADIAALAAGGIAPPAVALAATTAPSVAAVVAAAAPAEGLGVAAPAAAAAPAAPAAAPEVAAAAAAPAAAVAATTDVTAYLQGQIATKDASLLAANVEIAGLKTKLTGFEASMTGLMGIAAASLSNMTVAMGGSKVDLSALSATELLARHETAKDQFQKTFVAGGIAAVDNKADTGTAAASVEERRLKNFVG